MMDAPSMVALPLKADEHGTIRVSGTRVTLESVIADFHRSATPEEIVHDFPVLNLPDVYVIIGYYLQNRSEVDTYIQSQQAEGERVRQEWETDHPPTITKAELQTRLEAKRHQTDQI